MACCISANCDTVNIIIVNEKKNMSFSIKNWDPKPLKFKRSPGSSSSKKLYK